MNGDPSPANRPLLVGHDDLQPELLDAWTELFRLGIRYARIARERAAKATEKSDETNGATECA